MHYKCKEIICVSDEQLRSESYYRRLWVVLRELSENITRRRWLDEIADCLRDCEADIFYANGEPYPIPLPDDVFDAEMRWITEYLKSDPSGQAPLIRSRKLERLRLLDLYVRVHHTDIAQHIEK